ncbi:MAG: hypothetical protein Q8P02_00350, partial [Candidatus Micrarchaeota archaeon]|nr:hypothetical protein [Candidatus Micrarchaeota archaeon]
TPFEPEELSDNGPPPETLGPLLAPSCSATLEVQSGICDQPPRSQSFTGRTTRFDLLPPNRGLERVANLELERSEFHIRFASEVFACGQDFDSIRSATGFLAVNAERFHPTVFRPQQPVTITLKNLPYATMPRLFVFDGFAETPESVINQGQNCAASSRCFNLAFDSVAHTLTFQANGFSSYATSEAQETDGTGTNQLKLRCPGGLVVQETATVSVFNVQNGVPKCVSNSGFSVIGNGSAQENTFLSCDSLSGRHAYAVNTSQSGHYVVSAQLDGQLGQCEFEVVGRAPTPTPELHAWLIVLMALAAFGWARNARSGKVNGPPHA